MIVSNVCTINILKDISRTVNEASRRVTDNSGVVLQNFGSTFTIDIMIVMLLKYKPLEIIGAMYQVL